MDIIYIEHVIGLLGAILSSVSFLPQVLKIWRSKSAADISMSTILLLAGNALCWLVYGVLKEAKPLWITNSIMLTMLLVIVYFKVIYRKAEN